MTRRKILDRRTFLRGAGTVAIALPFLDAMRASNVLAATPAPPLRAFNLFFGLGFPTPLQSEGYSGPMRALSSVKDKLLIVRGVDQVRCDENGINAHFDGAAGAFTAEAPNGEALSGGPSLDQVLRGASQLPPGVSGALLAGTYFRRSRPARYIHSWKTDGSPADLPEESPAGLFSKVFGSLPGETTPSTEDARKARYRKSVLDSVISQYQHYQSDASNLSKASRARIADHLDRVRNLEQKAFGTPVNNGCKAPTAPGNSTVPHGGASDPDGQGIDLSVDQLITEWRTLSEIYAVAIQCDLARFGGLTFQAAGERIRLKGSYQSGNINHSFDDKGRRNTGGDIGCSHEWWHEFGESKANNDLRAHLELMLSELAGFLKLLDDPAHADENGKTILENSLITISTESGDGRHSDTKRELSGVFHAISGANDRFKTGSIVDAGAEGLDLYNTLLEAHGVSQRLGPSGRALQRVDAILL